MPFTIVDPAPLPPPQSRTQSDRLAATQDDVAEERDLFSKCPASPECLGCARFSSAAICRLKIGRGRGRGARQFSRDHQACCNASTNRRSWTRRGSTSLRLNLPMKGRARLCPYYFVAGEAMPVRRVVASSRPSFPLTKNRPRYDRRRARAVFGMMTNPLIEYTLLAFGSLFVIVDPFATVPAFIAMTPRDTPSNASAWRGWRPLSWRRCCLSLPWREDHLQTARHHHARVSDCGEHRAVDRGARHVARPALAGRRDQ